VFSILVGGLPILLSLFLVRRTVQWYRDRDPIVEVLDYCVIDTRFFKEWVCWQDVREIVLMGSGIIALKVENEDHYARDWKCICRRLHDLLSDEPLPKLLFVPGMLDCTPGELLAAIRSASDPYGIPIRRFAEEAAPRSSLVHQGHVERLRHSWTVALSTPQRMLGWR
jgi:hypothetical protein